MMGQMSIKVMAVIVFDFDDCASDKRIQELIKKLVHDKNEVWILTMRKENDYSKVKLMPILKTVGLSEYNLIYCNEKPKFEMLQMLNADIYIDNQNIEFSDILNHSTTIPLLFQSKN